MLDEPWGQEVHRYEVQGARFVVQWSEDGGTYGHAQPSRGT